jgi:hypothetical protein
MNLNPPPIASGWGEDSKKGPIPVWALWFQSLTQQVSGNLTIAPGAGAITSYTATYEYRQIGNYICLLFDITITNAGTGSGALLVDIPHTSATNITGSAREVTVGFQCSCSGSLATRVFGILKYDDTTVIATGQRIIGSVNYFI